VEIDVQGPSGVKRTKKWVHDGDDLEQTTGRAIYAGFRVGEIRSAKNDESVEIRFDGGQVYLQKGESYGEVEGLLVQREMIRRTIREHLDKELRLRSHGIKVLSLFFIDKVDRYRQYDEDGEPVKSDYAVIFEEEYARLAQHPRYTTLFDGVDLSNEASAVHGGYFSIDKKSNRAVDTKESNKEGQEAAQRVYELIMREKEQLLALETPLKFIFSHSALREGWDNPNVFQICTLRDVQTERERRQTIGRGLRLCVNQEGDRVRDASINTLTVIATESYEQFAESLQKEIEEETGIRFGVIEKVAFAGIRVLQPGGEIASLGHDRSMELWNHLQREGYLNTRGEIQDSLRAALQAENVSIPPSFSEQQDEITAILRRRSGRFEVKNADERTKVRARRAVLESSDFKALWNRIKYKTTYRVEFDSEKMIEDCASALRSGPPLPKARLMWRKAGLSIGKDGVGTEETSDASLVVLQENDIELPDILSELQNRTQLTRRSIRRILVESQRLDDFKTNPQAFIEIASRFIDTQKRLSIVDGIKYLRIGDNEFYAQELFETHELTGYLKNMIADPAKSVYDHVLYDFGVEERFAAELEKSEDVKLYAKLPGWFRIPTPLGSYNPDWAVLVERDGVEQLYFVVETKSSLFGDDLRNSEYAKIQCGKAHFAALASGEDAAKYVVSTSVEELLMQASA
jgi:type III restriction enzyme